MSRRLLWWLATLAGAAVGALLAFSPAAGEGPILCLFRRVADLPCPGCGLTRALSHLARGEVVAALALHPLSPLIAAELVAGWALVGLAAHGVARPRLRLERWVALTGFLLIAVWMGRLAVGDLAALE